VGNLRTIGIGGGWFQLCQDRKQWSEICSSAVEILAQNKGTITYAANSFFNLRTFQCSCDHSFRRKGDMARHRNFCRAMPCSGQLPSTKCVCVFVCVRVCVRACVRACVGVGVCQSTQLYDWGSGVNWEEKPNAN